MPTTETENLQQLPVETPGALKLIGTLAVRFHMLSEEQLQQALKQHKESDKQGPLGKTLIEMGVLSESQLAFLISAQEMKALRTNDIKFGSVAVENGFVTAAQVEAALKRQKDHYLKYKKKTLLGDILVANSFMSEEQRQSVMAAQQRILKAQHEHAEPPVAAQEERLLSADEGVELVVARDGLKASLRATASVKAEELKARIDELLREYEIVFGRAADEEIDEWLNQGSERDEWFVVARGEPAVVGHGGEIRYHFDTDPLKVGKIKEGDVIDFKDRGEIPQVNAGDLLAELSAPAPGTAGTDVHGVEIPPPACKRKVLLCGSGTALSGDGNQAIATLEGSPSRARTGALSVFPLYRIDGDVGYKTGHIDFDGDIQVSGTVEKGFKVSGGKLSANEVEAAEVNVKGDVVIAGGVIGAHIKAGGNLIAAYVHDSILEVDGDVLVKKEVMGCDIKAGGGFYSETSVVLDSRVAAKAGITAGDVGSDVSAPSSLMVASDALLELRIAELNEVINLQRKQQQEKRKKIAMGEVENQQINIEIAEAAQVQDRSQVEQRELAEQRDALIAQGESQQAEALTRQISEDGARAKRAEEKLNRLFDRQDQLAAEGPGLEQEIIEGEAQSLFISQELAALEQQMTDEQGDVCIKITGTLYPMTSISTAHTSVKTKQAMQALVIRERAKRGKAGNEEWKIVTESLK